MSYSSRTIRHIHLSGITPFRTAQALQDTLFASFLKFKADPSTNPSPTPTILTFQPTPTYTTGRRELAKPLSTTLLQELKSPLFTSITNSPKIPQYAEVISTPRGGLTTFHGPGQLVIYPILDLRSIASNTISPRCYINYLEEASILLLREKYRLNAMRTENPGVWLSEHEKIASLGVHMRRNITSYGLALNVTTERGWWDRIEACGLPGKKVVGIHDVLDLRHPRLQTFNEIAILAREWVHNFLSLLTASEVTHSASTSTTNPSASVMKSKSASDELLQAIKNPEYRTIWRGKRTAPNELVDLLRESNLGPEHLSEEGGFIQSLDF